MLSPEGVTSPFNIPLSPRRKARSMFSAWSSGIECLYWSYLSAHLSMVTDVVDLVIKYIISPLNDPRHLSLNDVTRSILDDWYNINLVCQRWKELARIHLRPSFCQGWFLHRIKNPTQARCLRSFSETTGEDLGNALQTATKKGLVDVVEELLNDGRTKLNGAFYLAVWANHAELVNLFIRDRRSTLEEDSLKCLDFIIRHGGHEITKIIMMGERFFWDRKWNVWKYFDKYWKYLFGYFL